MIRVLHISDLHEPASNQRSIETWRRRRVLGPAWDENLDTVARGGAIDLVCFTGDLASRGADDEYHAVGEFVERVLERLHVPRERFFVVPGNHDIHRATNREAWERVRRARAGDARSFSRWVAGKEAPPGLEDAWREQVLARGEAFRSWLRDFGRGDLLPERSPHGRLGYRKTLSLDGRPFPIHVIGLDSSWLSGDDDDQGKLLLTEDQVALLATERGASLPGLRLALIHHPLDHLADQRTCRRLLAEHAHLLLRGHLHEEELAEHVEPNSQLAAIAAGCLYETERWPNACHVVEIFHDDAGQPLRYGVRFRGWSLRGHWFDDNGLYKGTREGRLEWTTRSRPPTTTASIAEESIVDQLRGYMDGPLVDGTLISRALKESFAAALPDHARRMAAVAEAGLLCKRADPGSVVLEAIYLPPKSEDAFSFWQQTFEEARLLGPRFVAALVLAQSPRSFRESAKRDRERLLAELPVSEIGG